MSIGASDNRETFENLLPNCHKIEPPLDHKVLGKVETLLKRRDVAAFMMEPIICNLGPVVSAAEFAIASSGRDRGAAPRVGVAIALRSVAFFRLPQPKPRYSAFPPWLESFQY